MDWYIKAATAAGALALPDHIQIPLRRKAVAQQARGLSPHAGSAGVFAQWMSFQSAATPATTGTMLPAAFFASFLGPQMHTGSALFVSETDTLMNAEHNALLAVCADAALADGQDILELGCGWGAMSLLMAESFPRARITAVTRSHRQHAYVSAQAQARGLHNVIVLRREFSDLEAPASFDRVVALDAFSHTANWRVMLGNMRFWLKPGGKVFIQTPSHITTPYRPARSDISCCLSPAIMPSQGLMRQFGEAFGIEAERHWRGAHPARTLRHWLQNFDRATGATLRILRATHGREAETWHRRWRAHFIGTEQMFRHAFGDVWGISSFRLAPIPLPAPHNARAVFHAAS
jgi:cyclopropane-fatty-acyl-phospholipid synthase